MCLVWRFLWERNPHGFAAGWEAPPVYEQLQWYAFPLVWPGGGPRVRFNALSGYSAWDVPGRAGCTGQYATALLCIDRPLCLLRCLGRGGCWSVGLWLTVAARPCVWLFACCTQVTATGAGLAVAGMALQHAWSVMHGGLTVLMFAGGAWWAFVCLASYGSDKNEDRLVAMAPGLERPGHPWPACVRIESYYGMMVAAEVCIK